MNASSRGSRPDVSVEEFRELAAHVGELERRVAALEMGESKRPAESPPVPELKISSDAIPAAGRAVLAIGGAYLLRALVEFHIIAASAGVSAGAAYACFWLWRALQSDSRLMASASAVILAPLLWEAVMRLHAIPVWGAALILTIYSFAALLRPRVATIACAAAASTAAALFVGTHDLIPFTCSLLAIAAGCEFADVPVRWFAAAVLDLAIVLLTLLMSRGLPEGYAPVTLGQAIVCQALLVFIFAAAIAARRREATIYEIVQTAAAVLIGAGGVLYLTHAWLPIGIAAAAAAAACFSAAVTKSRNAQVFVSFAVMLLAAAAWLLLPRSLVIPAWCALAVALCFNRFNRLQAPLLLAFITVITALQPPSRVSMTSVLIAGFTCYLKSRGRVAPLAAAAVALWAAISLLAFSSIAFTAFAIALAWSGARFKRTELVWLMYVLMTGAALRILLRDFSHASTITLMVSLLLYGGALIALPRLARAQS